MKIKAIETRYKNRRFRSRIEARWAIYFDALELQWDYEIEGYEFDDGTRYLPDFLLTRGDGSKIWIEIKGELPTHLEIQKMQNLILGTRIFGYFFIGSPSSLSIYECFVGFPVHLSLEERVMNKNGLEHLFKIKSFQPPKLEGRTFNFNKTNFEQAKENASSARFEFGDES